MLIQTGNADRTGLVLPEDRGLARGIESETSRATFDPVSVITQAFFVSCREMLAEKAAAAAAKTGDSNIFRAKRQTTTKERRKRRIASMNCFKFLSANVGMEPALFLYMLSSFLKYPVFQSLLYEKSCFERYTDVDCTNVSYIFADIRLQADANHMYLLSSVCLTVPSIVIALVLGSISDVWNAKIPMLLPFVGLILCDINYIIQCTFMKNDISWLLLSDVIFGMFGGFTAIIGTIFSYSTKTTKAEFRSERMSALEGSIGLGGTIGYAISGSLRELIGYANIFLIQTVLHTLGFAYILYFARDIVVSANPALDDSDEVVESTVTQKIKESLKQTLTGIFEMFQKLNTARLKMVLGLTLVALGIELFVFSGIADIQFSYFRYVLTWSDKQFGWFSGLGYACNTLMVFVFYPLLHHKFRLTDAVLCMGGIGSKIIYCLLLSFVFSDWMAYAVVVIFSLNRFVSTGMRAICADIVQYTDQGKLFSFIALIEGVTNLLASLLFNSVYPKTLHFFSGTMFLTVAVILVIPMAILWKVWRYRRTEDTDPS